MDGMIVGLGNPEPKYLDTRHNLGFLVVDQLLSHCGAGSLSGAKFKAELWKARVSGGDWLLVKPQTYMNLSGECVQPLAAWHRLEPHQILVIHDDLDLAPGRMKFKKGGGNAGHNGLKSITQMLGTPDFYRLRLGIGRPQAGETIGWVLGRLSPTDRSAFEKMLPTVRACVELFAAGDVSAATRTANGYASEEPVAKPGETGASEASVVSKNCVDIKGTHP